MRSVGTVPGVRVGVGYISQEHAFSLRRNHVVNYIRSRVSSPQQAIDPSQVQSLPEARELIDKLRVEVLRHEQELRLRDLKIKDLLQRLYGHKSEKVTSLDPGQLELLAEVTSSKPDPALEEVLVEKPEELERAPSHREPRHRVPDHVESEVVRLEPEEKTCPHCGQAKCVTGEDVHEELDYIPAKLIRRQIVRPVLACQTCAKTSVQAPKPPQVVDRGLAAPGLIAQVVLAKYVDHLPLYRQEQQFARLGVTLPRQRLCDWVGKASWWFEGIYRLMKGHLLQGPYLQIDETPVKVMDPDLKGQTAKGFLWVIAIPGGDVIFHFDPSRGKKAAKELLGDYRGTLQSDAYSVYESLSLDSAHVSRIGCWAHVRRKFFEAQSDDKTAALAFLADIQGLYRIETQARDKALDFAARGALRQELAPQFLDRIHARMTELNAKVIPQSPLGKAISYTLNEWSVLQPYVTHGEWEIDNNLIENSLRPVGIGRKNWLFLGHPQAADRSAILYSIVASCKRRGYRCSLNPIRHRRIRREGEAQQRLP